MTRRVCMIVHQFDDDAGATAYRMLFRAQYLQSRGYEVHIFAPGKPNYECESLTGIQLHRIPAIGASKTEELDYTRLKKTHASKLASNLLPFAGYIRWLPALIPRLRKFNGDGTILYSYNNPISLHLAALAVQKKFEYWVCEFRDPIVGYEYSSRGWLGKFTDRWLEKKISTNADMICFRKGIQAEVDNYALCKGSVVLLPDYGVDLNLFKDFSELHKPTEALLGVYAGTVFNDISFAPLSAALTELNKHKKNENIEIFGPKHPEHSKYDNLIYGGNVKFKSLLEIYKRSNYLIVYDLSETPESRNAKFFPSKLAEIFATKRPVLFIGDKNSQTAKYITDLEVGICVENRVTAIANGIRAIRSGLESKSFKLSMSIKKKELIDANIAEEAFFQMLADLRN